MKLKKEIILLPLFSQPVAIFKLNIDHKKIHYFLKNTKYKELINPTKFTSLISSENKLFDKHKKLKKLKQECENNINIYLKEILKYNCKFKIINSWSTKTPPNCFSHTHSHPHTLLSCVYYPSFSKNFKITFKKNEGIYTFFEIESFECNFFNSKTWTITPELGTLLIFPSTLKHRIEPNIGKEDRFSFAFCVNPIGKFGKNTDYEIDFV
jgi:uncharacterized protein (TIGR02466 family)